MVGTVSYTHLIETKTVFKDMSSEIQNDLIGSVFIAVNKKICAEINHTDFVFIQADKTTDVSIKVLLRKIWRYVQYINGLKIEEAS